jgi:energy-coupling factor transporter ATP-binding protein EcfA2
VLTKLSIQNFKGIGSCDFKEEDLARINLLVGRNDSGKSTIMEAIYYMLQESCVPPKLSEIMSRRTDVFCGGSELWFKYRMEQPIAIIASFDSVELQWRIEFLQGRIISTLMQRVEMPRFVNTPQGPVVQGRVRNWNPISSTAYQGRDFSISSQGGRAIDALVTEDALKNALRQYATSASYIDCTIKSRTIEIERILARFKILGTEKKFGEILDDIYGKGKEWEFMPQLENPDNKRLAIREAGQLKYFSDFGDGFRCCAGILGTAMSLKNSAIFIEEIESHQHSGSLSKLIRHLVDIARENSLQIFLSTHSLNVFESLNRGVYKEDTERQKEEFRCLLIEREPETGKTSVECTDDVKKITDALQ